MEEASEVLVVEDVAEVFVMVLPASTITRWLDKTVEVIVVEVVME